MRADAMLLLAVLATALAPATVQARSLGNVIRSSASFVEALPAPSSPLGVAGPGESARLSRRRVPRDDATGAGAGAVAPAVGGAGPSGPARVDAWDALLSRAGIEERDARPIAGGSLTPAQAARLLEALLGKPVTLAQFPSRLAAGHLLRKVLEEGELSRAELLRQVERFSGVVVLRPDGCLAWVRSGETQQRVAPVEWRAGGFRAHGFELGRFYDGRTGVYRLLDDTLREADGRPLADVHDDADYVGRTLDGAEAAFVKLALSVGHFLTYPLDSIASLKNLPAGVAALIESSPEYFERFRHMTRGEQIQAVAELATNLLLTTGTAAATTRTVTGSLAGAEALVPRVALSAQGALAIERVAVPVGRAASVLGGGPGAAIILQRAGTAERQTGPSKGPGQWGPAKESMKPRARRYQEQITGHSADEAYWVGGVGKGSGGVKFDGYEKGVLLEAKGPGYAKFFEELEPKRWFRHSGAKALIEQARRQLDSIQGKSIPIRWHVAEVDAADAIRKLLDGASISGIEVVHTLPLP
ncbi:Tox-REase-5 domain-containing protein [Myxococcus sp. SDU36]|uniref:Tox-REase-5 domain-containing protein n=1 Tax=Myxococcus sp. SDU36 TaxID=2831967 RepID=UPI002543B8EC|nr:Tox-REase-5 domain-containing protein [Myxococcus sp. SDU36]WIG95089.1 restriction endonuclease fold toxin 5 domain-containing protein [Myxococcus sp. SDU36]